MSNRSQRASGRELKNSGEKAFGVLPGRTTPTALVLEPGATLEQCAHALRVVGDIGTGWQWWVGDLLVYMETYFGEEAPAALTVLRDRYESQTLMNLAWVSRSVHRTRRREELLWSHHETVAGMDAELQAFWLDLASQGDELPAGGRQRWTSKKLRQEIRAGLPPKPRASATAAAQDANGPPPEAPPTPAVIRPVLVADLVYFPASPDAEVYLWTEADPVYKVVAIYRHEGQILVKCVEEAKPKLPGADEPEEPAAPEEEPGV